MRSVVRFSEKALKDIVFSKAAVKKKKFPWESVRFLLSFILFSLVLTVPCYYNGISALEPPGKICL